MITVGTFVGTPCILEIETRVKALAAREGVQNSLESLDSLKEELSYESMTHEQRAKHGF